MVCYILDKKIELKKALVFLSLTGFLFFSCASNPYSKVDAAIEKGDYRQGLMVLEEEKKDIYWDKDIVLYDLDKGMIAHYAQQYDDSIQLLQNGERAIEEAFTKSVTMEIGSYILNDTTKEYDGEDYEDIYINAFNALNYYHNDMTEEALVEIRQMNDKLRFLSSKYGEVLTNLQQKALDEGNSVPPNQESTTQFSDSALARYLGMLFYRGDGSYDDARIDRDQLKAAFANAPNVYKYAPPSSIGEELDIPPGKARLNIIGFSGLSPIKEEEVIRIPLPNYSYIKIALPVMAYRPSRISRIEVLFDNGKTFNLELLEDIEAVARETFKTKVNVIYIKSMIRGTIKGGALSALQSAGQETEGWAGFGLAAAGLGAKVFAEASEKADLRISRYFPAKAYVGGITLDPGRYSFNIQYYAGNEQIASFRHENVNIGAHDLNLVEAVCLK